MGPARNQPYSPPLKGGEAAQRPGWLVNEASFFPFAVMNRKLSQKAPKSGIRVVSVGAHREFSPLFEFGAHAGEFFFGSVDGDGPRKEVHWRIRFVGKPKDCLREFHGITGLK